VLKVPWAIYGKKSNVAGPESLWLVAQKATRSIEWIPQAVPECRIFLAVVDVFGNRRAFEQRHWAQLKEAGLCGDGCGRKALYGRRQCQRCLDTTNARARARRLRGNELLVMR